MPYLRPTVNQLTPLSVLGRTERDRRQVAAMVRTRRAARGAPNAR
jgi:hypothetical protein